MIFTRQIKDARGTTVSLVRINKLEDRKAINREIKEVVRSRKVRFPVLAWGIISASAIAGPLLWDLWFSGNDFGPPQPIGPGVFVEALCLLAYEVAALITMRLAFRRYIMQTLLACGRCPACGYIMRETPRLETGESRCSECGSYWLTPINVQ